MRISFVLFVLATATLVRGATSTAWELSGFSDFLKGRINGLSLSQDGTLEPGRAIRFNHSVGQPALWNLAAGRDGIVYAATGHGGKLVKVGPDGAVAEFWTATQPEVFALCTDAKGNVYAGTSPNGGLYQIDSQGHAIEIWHSPEKYIWNVKMAGDGSLYVGTGEQGRIYHLVLRGNSVAASELFYETNQGNVTALTLAPNGTIYAGTEPNGLLFSIVGKAQGTVLLDSALPEIRAIVLGPDGSVYAAAMGGAVSSRSGAVGNTAGANAGSASAVAASPTVITVTESKENDVPADDGGTAIKTPDASRAASSASVSSVVAAPATGSVTEVGGVEKSVVYRITPDRAVEALRSSKDDNVYDLLLDGDGLLVGTDVRGRVYRLVNRSSTLLTELGDGVATRFLQLGSSTFIGLSNPGRLILLDNSRSETAQFESPVHDATAVARWGHLQFHGVGSDIRFRTRSGFSARPDSTWSAWSEPIPGNNSSLIASPPARFIQWRAEWPAGSSTRINTVDIPFLPRNGPPAIHSVTVSSVVGNNAAKSASAGSTAASNTAYSITVTDTGEAPAASSANTTSQIVTRLQGTQTQISWQADDPDGDKLAYSVYFRAEDETAWQLVRSRMFENTLLLDPDVFADGRYFFRVVASDSPANAAEFAQESEMVSMPVLVDNTPPEVQLGVPARHESSLDVDVSAADKTSSLRLCEYALDAGSWHPLESVDGVTDSPQEKFHLHLEALRPGEHLLVVRAFDSVGNAGLGRIILR